MTIKYPSIEQFKHLIRTVKDKVCYRGKDEDNKPIYVDAILPVIELTCTTKIHGTNAAIRYTKSTDELVPQSRERDLSLTSDNAGFYVFVKQREEFFKTLCRNLIGDNETIVLYGEWFGKGIQKGVAVSEVEKKLALFDIRYINGESDTWEANYAQKLTEQNLDLLHQNDVYVIDEFGATKIAIDFNDPRGAQNVLVQMTEQVEQECPVGKFFGVSGIGEGIVVKHVSGEYGRLLCKVKGDKHSNSKVKTLAPVDEESFKAAKEFAETFVTRSRLEQGIHVMKAEMQLEAIDKNVGAFLKWISQDVIKEEQNAIIENNLDPKKIVKEISNIARKWYFEQI